MRDRIVFMGSPEFALPTLHRLAGAYPVVGVVTQPDRPAGRGRQPTPPPVKTLALSLGLPVIQPEKLRDPAAMDQLHAWSPTLIVVAAFGKILRQNVLDLPTFGCINVHASLLPRWRGAAPIQAAILHGDPLTGVSIMKMDAGLDTGPVLSQRELTILPDETAGNLSHRLADLGAELLIETLPDYLDGKLLPVPQDESMATYAPTLRKEEGLLDFTLSPAALVNRVRAFHPWPGAYTEWQGQPLKIHQAFAAPDPNAVPGSRSIRGGLPAIGAQGGWLVLELLQPAGKRAMSGREFLSGARTWLVR